MEGRGRRTLWSSNTPCLIFAKISQEASTKACSTLNPDFALASTKSIPSSFAHCSASSCDTSLTLPFTVCEAVFLPLTDLICNGEELGGLEDVRDTPAAEGVGSSHRSTLLPTRIHETWGSACSRTSANQLRALRKPIRDKRHRQSRFFLLKTNWLFRDVTS